MKVGRLFFYCEFDGRMKPAKSFYGSHAMAKTFLEMLAPAEQRLKSTFYGLHRRCKHFQKHFGRLQRAIKDILQR